MRLQPAEFLIICAKRLLQHNRHKADIVITLGDVSFRGNSGQVTEEPRPSRSLGRCSTIAKLVLSVLVQQLIAERRYKVGE